MTGTTKAMVGVVITVVVGSAAALALRSSRATGPEVRMEAVANRDLVAKVTASGNIRARVQVDMSSDISARVQQMHVREGDDVREGDLLLELDRTQFEAALARARATLSQSQANASQNRANLLRAQRENERVTALQARDPLLVSQQQVDDAETNLQVAEANLEAAQFGVAQAQAGVEEAEDRLEKTIFRAPMSGKITRLNVEQGETVVVGTMNNPGSLVLSISDLSVVEAVVRVDETDIPLLTLGDSAVVEIDAFPNRTFTGRVTEIGNSAIQAPSQQSGAQQAIDFEVVVTLDPTDVQLRPDLSATAEVVTDIRPAALAVPIIAVTLREPEAEGIAGSEGGAAAGDGPPPSAAGRAQEREVEGVFLVRSGTVTFRPIELGIAGEEHFEVLSGLQVGDTVVAGPYQAIRQLRSGDPVRRMDGVAPAGASTAPAAQG
ncbi:MAG: efflux RND transporter periplasmic adaptor subunit [Longimicrobiales bacterium]|nr:efflux RND transporter periplasmic adaptor subunit [Longimicrobiales bacterium]